MPAKIAKVPYLKVVVIPIVRLCLVNARQPTHAQIRRQFSFFSNALLCFNVGRSQLSHGGIRLNDFQTEGRPARRSILSRLGIHIKVRYLSQQTPRMYSVHSESSQRFVFLLLIPSYDLSNLMVIADRSSQQIF